MAEAGGAGGGSVVSSVMKEFRLMKEKFKDEDDETLFQVLEKSTVLQECRVFHDAAFVKMHPKRCCELITKLLFLLTQGENFSGPEASEVFFGVTKLFQSPDGNLRRMVYLFLKEVAEVTDAGEIIIVHSSLTKDMNQNQDTHLYRANALRVLRKIIDSTMLGQNERYIKQAIVDKHDLVASSALVAGLHLFAENPDIVRHWVSEVQSAVQAKRHMVQFHALALLRRIKQHDRLAVSKLVTQLMRGSVTSPLALCLLIRYTSSLLHEDMSATNARAAYEFLESCLKERSEMVMYEAARAICALPKVVPRDLAPAVTVLHLFLSSPKPALRFAAVKTLSKVAMTYPALVSKCNDDLESLITDSNRTIATLAITTLLKTGSESSVEKHMKQIMSFMSEIADEFRITVVRAVHELCLRYPAKHRLLFGYLADALREEGGYDFKKAILDSMMELIDKIPDAKTEGLFQLCEFIEDCEYTQLSTRVLHLLGDAGPTTSQPGSFIRFIYNRVILENAAVRSAAVTALAKFAARVEWLRPSIVALLARSLHDEDDEVRDRAALHLALLRTAGDGSPGALVSCALPLPVTALAKALHAYQLRPPAGSFSFEALPHVEVVDDAEETAAATGGAGGGDGGAAFGTASRPAGAAASTDSSYADDLYKIPAFASLGPLFRSTRPSELTETELEYVVNCVRHVFADHVVFQFNVTNTVPEQVLMNVSVAMEASEPDAWEEIAVVPATRVACNVPTPSYVCLRRNPAAGFPTTTFACELKYTACEVDPATKEALGDGFEEDYPLEDLEVGAADFVAKVQVEEFKRAWEAAGADGEVIESFQLSHKSVEAAVSAVADFLGMQFCEGTGSVASNARAHMALLSGVFVGGIKVLARMQVKMDRTMGCLLKIGVRSDDPDISRVLVDCIH
uniref:Coatomer subunit gamma n=1 Tax=Bicosoecida sp. CB-2014 TaxID=1486930 RepID=A0A7S1GAC4_9STRA